VQQIILVLRYAIEIRIPVANIKIIMMYLDHFLLD